MTSTPTTKEAASAFRKAIHERDLDALDRLTTPDAEWWLLGRPESGTPFGGSAPLTERKPMLELLWKQFATWSFVEEDMIVEGNKAVITVLVDGDRFDGKHYHNDAAMILTVQDDGKIKRIQEWFDLKAVDKANSDVMR